ncbi:MAG: hypothetical protein H6659_02090 [Ardenticatenaceae bacterium]|nr:hypothetical protein [Anaerolineales bacterium]MCB8982595.1 hypothetical protein [Ardenticatenaceae bacterium]
MDALILYVSIGSGHQRAAEVLAETLTWQLGWQCQTRDLLSVLSPRFPYLANHVSARLLKLAASFYDRYWADDEALEAVDHVLKISDMVGMLRDLVEACQPALCLCTHALPARILSLVWQKDGRSRPTLNVATDFMMNGLWPVEKIDAFVVASAASRLRLMRRGYPARQIYALGIPVAANCARSGLSQENLRRKLRLDHVPTLLAITGGHRTEPYAQVARIVGELCQHWAGSSPAMAWQLVVITGRNEYSLAALRQLAPGLPCRLVLLPFVQHIEDWMAASDLLLTKPGGLTVAEALNCGVPQLLVGIGPGQEQANAELLMSEGCAVVGAPEIDRLAGQIASLLADAPRRAAMRRACLELARPQAARQIACLAQQIVQGEIVYE